MPDGPSVEIRITADTGGIEAAKARLAELKSALGATQGQMIALGGGTDELRAKSAALTAQIGQTRREIAGLASAAQDSSSALSASRGGAEVAAGGLKTMEGASRGLGQELRHGIALIDEFSRGARGAMVSSLVAAARDSGYLGTAIAALKGPFGVALAGSAALAAGLYLLIERAHETEVALRGVYNASLLMGGVSPAGAELGARSAMTALGSSGVMGSSSIDKYVEAVYKLGDASDGAKQKLIALGPALYIALGKDDKALEKYVAHFQDTSSLKSFIEEQGLATDAQSAAVDQAVQAKNADALRAIALDTLTKRLSGANAAIAQAGHTATSGLAAGLAAQAGSAPFAAEAFLPGAATGQTRLPATPAGARPQAIEQALEWQQKYNRVANETAVIEQNIAAMTKARAAASTDAARAQYDAMIKNARDQEAALKAGAAKKAAGPGQPSESDQLRARMAAAEDAAAAHAKNLKDLHQGELQADISVLQQELSNEKLTAAQRLAVEADLARKKAELMASTLRGGRGRGARAPSAAAERGGGADARSQYEDYAAGARERIAATQATVPSGSGSAGAASEIAAQRAAAAQIQAIYQEWAARAKAQFGETSREYQNVMRQMTAATSREASQQARAVAQASREAYAEFAAAERDKIAAAAGATGQILAIYQDWATRAAAVFGQQSTQYQDVMRQMTEAADRASEHMQEAFAKPLDSVGSSLERAATGLLTRQTTVRQAEQQGYRSLIGSGVDEIGGALNQSLSSALFGSGTKSLGQGLVGMLGIGKPGGLFGSGIGAVSADTTQATLATTLTANTAAVTANTAALTTSAGAAVSGGALSGVGGVASGVGGIGSFLGSLPLIGSLFGGGAAVTSFGIPTAIAAAGAPFGFKNGGIVPSFAHGGIMPRHHRFSLPSYAAGGVAIPGLAKLHENEMVLPSHISQAVQRMAAGGGPGAGGAAQGAGGDVHLHMEGSTVLDGPSFHRWFQANGGKGMVADMVKSAFRSNALTPRTV